MTTQTTKDAMLALMRFGAACLAEHRESISDLDGDWLQERAIEVGLLEAREMNEPCGPNCECDTFPTECLFPRVGVSCLLGGTNLADAWHELCHQHDAALKLAKELRHQRAHTYASENADLYRGFDNGCRHAAVRIEAIFAPKEGK